MAASAKTLAWREKKSPLAPGDENCRRQKQFGMDNRQIF
jgi:hypothetical protein